MVSVFWSTVLFEFASLPTRSRTLPTFCLLSLFTIVLALSPAAFLISFRFYILDDDHSAQSPPSSSVSPSFTPIKTRPENNPQATLESCFIV